MRMIPVFREKESFMFRLHPMTQLAAVLGLVIASLVTDNPFLLAAIIMATAILARAADVFSEWASWWKLCLVIGLLALLINPLVSREGVTVLWRGPRIPVFGRLDITLEAIVYGAGMALRLTAIIWAFALLSLIMDPDRALGLMRGKGSRSALLSALAMRMIPTSVRDAGEILDAQRARGVAKDSGRRSEVARSRIPLIKNLVMTGMDRAIGLAEAMEARAYGSGRRTRYHVYSFGPGDLTLILVSIAVLAVVIVGTATGSLSFDYYPSISWSFTAENIVLIAVPVFLASGVLLLSWSWRRWNWLKLRI